MAQGPNLDYLYLLLLLIPLAALVYVWCCSKPKPPPKPIPRAEPRRPIPRAEPKLAPVYVPEAPAPAPVSGIPYELLGRPGDMLTEAECEAFGVPYGTTYSGESFIDHPEHPMPARQLGYGGPEVRRSNQRRGEGDGLLHVPSARARSGALNPLPGSP